MATETELQFQQCLRDVERRRREEQEREAERQRWEEEYQQSQEDAFHANQI